MKAALQIFAQPTLSRNTLQKEVDRDRVGIAEYLERERTTYNIQYQFQRVLQKFLDGNKHSTLNIEQTSIKYCIIFHLKTFLRI